MAILASWRRPGSSWPTRITTSQAKITPQMRPPLCTLAVAFPTLPHAQQWLATADQRFQWQFDDIIDADGQLIDNSPYYDFSN